MNLPGASLFFLRLVCRHLSCDEMASMFVFCQTLILHCPFCLTMI